MRGLNNKETGKWKRYAACCALLLIFGVLTNSVHNVYKKKLEAEQTLVRMQKEVSDLKARQETLGTSLQRLGTEEGLALEMRKKLNVAQVGESVAIIVDESNSVTTSTPELSAWQKFKDFMIELFK